MLGRTLRLPLFETRREPSPSSAPRPPPAQPGTQAGAQGQGGAGAGPNGTVTGRRSRPEVSTNAYPSAGLPQPPPSPAGPSSGAGAAAGSGSGSDAPGAHDSITLGQLKAMMPPPPTKQKTQQFDYRYDDTDTVMNELDEFYPYVEMTHVAQNPERFEGSFDGVWIEAPLAKRKAYMEVQLEKLESSIADTRRAAQGRLLYLLQGCFAQVTSPEMQLHWIRENARTLRSVDGVSSLVVGLRDAAKRYSAMSDMPDRVTGEGNLNPHDPYDERSAELMDSLAMLYFTVEVSRTDEDFGEELMSVSPALPLVLFQMIAALKDRLPKGFPVKKVLLLLWKTLLACLGGIKEVGVARALSRELAGLPPADKDFTKATPMDITSFRRDISVKYPTFAPGTSATISVPNDKLAEGNKPLPKRANYHSTDLPDPPSKPDPKTAPGPPSTTTQAPQPGTPAPTPPGSPAPPPKRKTQYQTDPTRPFVFPFSRHGLGDPLSLVPAAIAEADGLYHRHAYVSLGLYQLYQAREECLREERGLGVKGLIGFERLALDDEADEAAEEAMRREWKYEEEEMEATERGDMEGVKRAREKRAAAKRLYRVEIIYKNTLSILQPCVIVLLKLLLATVTGPGNGPGGAAPEGQGADAQAAQGEAPAEELPPPTREEVDLARHREITSKAVSAILVLLMKWFKASHVLKFHYFAQLLFDSNCLLLVLKMFGLSDVAMSVQARNEWDDWNFFRYCHLNCSKSPPNPRPPPFVPKPVRAVPPRAAAGGISAPLDSPSKATALLPGQAPLGPAGAKGAVGVPAGGAGAGVGAPAGGAPAPGSAPASASAPVPGPASPPPPPTGEPPEIELVTEYSWRNFFSTINFLKVLQKMTKHRGHRTFMLQQYKSSQIMKRMLRINHPMLQLQVLKLIKSQMPWCGKKWRQTNMKVITAIYLNCRPELRDEWLSGQDQEIEQEDALPQEQALRTLIQFYNKHNYPSPQSNAPLHSPDALAKHRRADSVSGSGGFEADAPPRERRPAPRQRTSSYGSDSDVFPPRRTDASVQPLPYNPDGMIEFWLHEYEDVLGEVFGEAGEGEGVWDEEYGHAYGFGLPPSPRRPSYDGDRSGSDGGVGAGGAGAGALSPGLRSPRGTRSPRAASPRPHATRRSSGDGREDRAWTALGEMMGEGDDGISDSESVVSVGELGEDAHLGLGGLGMGLGMGMGMGLGMGLGMGMDDEEEAFGGRARGVVGAGDEGRGPEMGALARIQRRRSTENENSWADMATKTLAALPRSPAERRRSSSGQGQRDSPLRAVGARGTRSGSASGSGSGKDAAGGGAGGGGGGGSGEGGPGSSYQDAQVFDDEDDEEDLPGPMPIKRETQDEVERDFGAVDEVEYAYGE